MDRVVELSREDYVIYNRKMDTVIANKIYIFIIFISILMYLYFFNRNYKAYMNSNIDNRELFKIKLFGSILFIVGGVCLLYFQVNNNSFIFEPII